MRRHDSAALRLSCEMCGVRLTVANGFIELCNQRGGYPEDAMTTAYRYACATCETSAYAIDFKRLLRDGLDGPAGWLRHLSGKEWMNSGCQLAVADAYELAATLQNGAQPAEPKPAVPTKPYTITQRPSRVSDNPRSISTRTRTRILERDGFRCRRCGAGPNDARLVIDHVVPVAKGGTADESNLQTLCHPCNSAKSDREPHHHDLNPNAPMGGDGARG